MGVQAVTFHAFSLQALEVIVPYFHLLTNVAAGYLITRISS